MHPGVYLSTDLIDCTTETETLDFSWDIERSPGGTMKRRKLEFMKKYYPFLVVFCLVLLYLAAIWLRPPFHPGETRELEIAREIASGNDWIPRLNGFPCHETPLLGALVNGLFMKWFGETPGAARLPGALVTLASAGLLYCLCRRSEEERVGRVAAVIFLLSGLVFLGGTWGMAGALFRFSFLLTMTMFFFACREKLLLRRFGLLTFAGFGMGMAILSGGFPGVVLPLATLVLFLLWQNEWKRIFTLPWIPLIWAFVIAGPTGGAASLQNSGEPLGFLLMNAPVAEASFWLALPIVIAGALPWILFLPGVIAGYRGHCGEAFRTPLLRYAVCMGGAGGILLAFSVTGWSSAPVLLPSFPAFAILFAWGLVRYAQSGKLFRETDRVLRLILFCGIPALVVLFAIQVFNRWLPGRVPAELLLYRSRENFYFPVFAAMVFLIWVGMALGTREAWAKFACFCVAVGFIFLAHPALLPPHLIVDRTPVDFIVRESRRALTPETLVLADSGMASATAWALRRADIGIYGNPGEFAARMESAGPGRFYSQDRLAAIIQSGVQPVLIVTDSEKLVREMPAALEKSYRRRGGLFIIHYRKQGEANL